MDEEDRFVVLTTFVNIHLSVFSNTFLNITANGNHNSETCPKRFIFIIERYRSYWVKQFLYHYLVMYKSRYIFLLNKNVCRLWFLFTFVLIYYLCPIFHLKIDACVKIIHDIVFLY